MYDTPVEAATPSTRQIPFKSTGEQIRAAVDAAADAEAPVFAAGPNPVNPALGAADEVPNPNAGAGAGAGLPPNPKAEAGPGAGLPPNPKALKAARSGVACVFSQGRLIELR